MSNKQTMDKLALDDIMIDAIAWSRAEVAKQIEQRHKKIADLHKEVEVLNIALSYHDAVDGTPINREWTG